jgi:hypothetical protein
MAFLCKTVVRRVFIHTENSYQYNLLALTDLAGAGGFAAERV